MSWDCSMVFLIEVHVCTAIKSGPASSSSGPALFLNVLAVSGHLPRHRPGVLSVSFAVVALLIELYFVAVESF